MDSHLKRAAESDIYLPTGAKKTYSYQHDFEDVKPRKVKYKLGEKSLLIVTF